MAGNITISLPLRRHDLGGPIDSQVLKTLYDTVVNIQSHGMYRSFSSFVREYIYNMIFDFYHSAKSRDNFKPETNLVTLESTGTGKYTFIIKLNFHCLVYFTHFLYILSYVMAIGTPKIIP